MLRDTYFCTNLYDCFLARSCLGSSQDVYYFYSFYLVVPCLSHYKQHFRVKVSIRPILAGHFINYNVIADITHSWCIPESKTCMILIHMYGLHADFAKTCLNTVFFFVNTKAQRILIIQTG